jgi:hypothetical protein
LTLMYQYMTTPPVPTDSEDSDLAQHVNHQDIYLDMYLRGFFVKASTPGRMRHVAT